MQEKNQQSLHIKLEKQIHLLSLQTHKQAERIRKKIIDDISTLQPTSPEKSGKQKYRSDLPSNLNPESAHKLSQPKLSPERLDMI